MDAHTPRREDDLSDVERRLAGWQPASGSLDADAMLFAAGRAASKPGRGRRLWPALCGLLAALALGLAVWGLTERDGRRLLASRLEHVPAQSTAPAPAGAVVPDSNGTPSPDGYYSLRRRMEQDPNRWLASRASAGPMALGPPPPEPSILKASQRDGLLDQ